MVLVSEGAAGTAVPCACGVQVKVPSFRELQQVALVEGPPAEAAEDESAVGWVVVLCLGALVFGFLAFGWALLAFQYGPAATIGAVVSEIGHFWLLALIIRHCRRDAVALALFVPFFTWWFAFQRWDIAKWPFVCTAGGLVLSLAAAIGPDSGRGLWRGA